MLSVADLFITSGGQNNILESIFFNPYVSWPISSEQRMNAIMIDKNRIGLSNTLKNKNYETPGKKLTT